MDHTLLALPFNTFNVIFIMQLTLQEVQKAAKLAHLNINKEDAENTLKSLNGIFSLITEMQRVDTNNVEPMSHAQEIKQRLREDIAENVDQRAAFCAIAPETENALYLVPKVVE